MEKTKSKGSLLCTLSDFCTKASPRLCVLLPYLIIFAISILSCLVLFNEGYPYGDDFYFHLPNILDKYLSLKGEMIFSPISSSLALGYGYGQGLFYSPLSHIPVAVTALILEPFGVGIFGALKLLLFLSVFVSGIFAYRLGLAISKGNRISALFCAALYVVFPYRMFDALCRLALAEAFAFLFIPLFFLGLYRITEQNEDRSVRVLPFFQVILGGSLLYLTHNLTALLVYIIGGIFLLLKIKTLVSLFKNPRFVIYCAVSVLLLLGVASVGMLTQLELMGTELYNVSNAEKMWTDRGHLVSQTGIVFSASGFLNTSFLTRYGFTPDGIAADLWIFVAGCIITVILDFFLTNVSVLKKYSPLICASFYVLYVVFTANRQETYAGGVIFLTLYFIYTRTYKKEKSFNKGPFVLSATPWLCLITLIICVVFMTSEAFWQYLAPELLLTIQFPWRSWALVQICASIALCAVITRFGKSFFAGALASVLIALVLVSSQPLIQKRTEYEINGDWCYELDTEYVMNSISSLGHNKEYCPEILTDTSYLSKYEASLHSQISKDLTSYTFANKDDYYLDPVFLEGNGAIKRISHNAPVLEFYLIASNSSLVQLPLIYYPGYVIYAEDEESGSVIEIEGENVDGLVAFRIDSGSYTVRSEYEGTALRRLSLVISPLCLLVASAWLATDVYLRKKRGKLENQSE